MCFRKIIELICEKLTKLEYYQLMTQLWTRLDFDLIGFDCQRFVSMTLSECNFDHSIP
jgi:hypothetical protein